MVKTAKKVKGICVVKDCNNKANHTIPQMQGLFYGRKQGMFVIVYKVCRKHYSNREVVADNKKLLKDNPHLKGAM